MTDETNRTQDLAPDPTRVPAKSQDPLFVLSAIGAVVGVFLLILTGFLYLRRDSEGPREPEQGRRGDLDPDGSGPAGERRDPPPPRSVRRAHQAAQGPEPRPVARPQGVRSARARARAVGP